MTILTKWGEKPYHSLDYHYKSIYSEKTYKIAINANLTCPNRDGTLDSRGCIFCSGEGSGEFTKKHLSIEEQITIGKELLKSKNPTKFIAYFQAFTNTYGEINHLKTMYLTAAKADGIVGLSIATRPDCLSDEVLSLLSYINTIKPVTVELGLQSIHPKTASLIRRGYDLSVFDEAVEKLQAINVEIVVHLILGLPFETKNDILESVNYVVSKPIHGIKLQLLHIIRDTDLATYYDNHPFAILGEDEYIDLLIDCIEIIPPHVVIHRLTGDGVRDTLIAPKWSLNKRHVLNQIHKRFKERHTYQGGVTYGNAHAPN